MPGREIKTYEDGTTEFTHIPKVNGHAFTSGLCEAFGGHEVLVSEWPPRTRNKNRTPSASGQCTRCLCHVAIYDPPGPVVTPVLPDGRRVTAEGQVVEPVLQEGRKRA